MSTYITTKEAKSSFIAQAKKGNVKYFSLHGRSDVLFFLLVNQCAPWHYGFAFYLYKGVLLDNYTLNGESFH